MHEKQKQKVKNAQEKSAASSYHTYNNKTQQKPARKPHIKHTSNHTTRPATPKHPTLTSCCVGEISVMILKTKNEPMRFRQMS